MLYTAETLKNNLAEQLPNSDRNSSIFVPLMALLANNTVWELYRYETGGFGPEKEV